MLLSSSTASVAPAAQSAPQSELRTQPVPQRAPATEPAAAKSADKPPAPDEVEKALDILNDFTARVAQDVRFAMDEESGRTIVKVVDTETQEVLRQFPSAEALSIARSIDKMQGLLIRDKA